MGIITDKKGVFSFFAKRKALKEYKKRQIELQRQAVSLGGKKEDIAGIFFNLSEGDIASPICSGECLRKDYIRSFFSYDRFNEQENMETTINEFWDSCIIDLQKLKAMPPKIRVWLDYTPAAQCGLLFIANLLKNSKTDIHIVELPQKITREDNCIVEYRGWGEVEPQLFGTFLDKEKVLTEKEIAELADKWELLKSENSSLRIVENGSVMSADISYYDDLIRKEFPESSCKIAQIIGNALGKQKIPTGDVFVAKRIISFIESGELATVGKTDDAFYSTTVSRCK